MNTFYILFILVFVLISSQKLLSENIFDSDFIDINTETLDANETKMSSINDVKNITLMNLTNKILDNKSKKKLYKIIEAGVNSDQFIQNIIIENEIITNEKYIAKIKINLNKEKFVNLLRNNKINKVNNNNNCRRSKAKKIKGLLHTSHNSSISMYFSLG